MDFKKATDELLSCITHQELADALGCSVASIRQARLADDAKARRSAPEGWERAVLKLARAQADHFRKLSERLANDPARK